jgi:hypothetical protein
VFGSFTVIASRCSVRGMMTFTELTPAPSDPPEPFTDRLRLAVAAYLARFKGSSREHTESDLRCYLAWCAERSLDPRTTMRYDRARNSLDRHPNYILAAYMASGT